MKLNIGCGNDRPQGWINADRYVEHYVVKDGAGTMISQHVDPAYADLTEVLPWTDGTFDMIVANHVLSDLTHHELPHALRELHRVAKVNGVLRILVPDLVGAFYHWEKGDAEWFPQDDRTGGLDAKFCTFLTWFGESRSVFTLGYLVQLLTDAGWSETARPPHGRSHFLYDNEIASLDGDRTTSLIVEAHKW